MCTKWRKYVYWIRVHWLRDGSTEGTVSFLFFFKYLSFVISCNTMWERDQVCMCSLECLARTPVPTTRNYYCCCCYCWWLWSSLSFHRTARRPMARSRHHNKCQIDSDRTKRRKGEKCLRYKMLCTRRTWIAVSCNESTPPIIVIIFMVVVVATYCNASIASAFWTWHLETSAQQIGTILFLTWTRIFKSSHTVGTGMQTQSVNVPNRIISLVDDCRSTARRKLPITRHRYWWQRCARMMMHRQCAGHRQCLHRIHVGHHLQVRITVHCRGRTMRRHWFGLPFAMQKRAKIKILSFEIRRRLIRNLTA